MKTSSPTPSIRDLLRFLSEYWDLMFAFAGGIAAVIVIIIGQFGQTKQAGIDAATLAVLVALSANLIRERWKRDRLGQAVDDVLTLTNATAPWEALEAEYTWEILNRNGTKAVASVRRLLRFLQTETLTIYEFSGSPGSVQNHRCEGRKPKTKLWQELPIMRDDFPGRQGRGYAIISLEGTMDRGHMLEVRSKRELMNMFTAAREYVSISVEVPTRELEMSLVWPSTRAPTSVRIERNSPRSVSEVPTSQIKRLRDGRTRYRHFVSQPAQGETITLSWDW